MHDVARTQSQPGKEQQNGPVAQAHRRGDVARGDHALDIDGGTYRGSSHSRQPGAVGTAPTSGGGHWPRAARKRRYMRIDVASARAWDREAVVNRRNSTSLTDAASYRPGSVPSSARIGATRLR